MFLYSVVGLGYTMGVLLGPLTIYFETEPSVMSWMGSIFVGIRYMLGPIVGGLVSKHGLRPVSMAGSIFIAIGFVLSPFAQIIPVIMITFGAVAGFGAGLMYLPANVAIGYYFESKRSIGKSYYQFKISPLDGPFL